jgi:hypothetical protein
MLFAGRIPDQLKNWVAEAGVSRATCPAMAQSSQVIVLPLVIMKDLAGLQAEDLLSWVIYQEQIFLVRRLECQTTGSLL